MPFVAPASDEGEDALPQFKVPPGFKVELFAAEPRLANPVAFYIDEQNRFYVVETFRRKKDVIDIRGVMHWLDDDIASRTVAARNAMVKKYLTPGRGVGHDAGLASASAASRTATATARPTSTRVFADGFNRLEDGIAAGVLARGGDVFFANIPSLWRLRDTNGDGVADVRDELHYGYGVRYTFNGHDLHGLRFGPDGKLYFSIGDRGLHVEKTPDGRVVSNPDSGAVLRCNPDGTELELVHTGLRNPQELAFDEFGNLFTGDNNSDGGDTARWVYVVEGGDSGWRIGYQHQEWPVSRGPWNHEGIWMDPTRTFPAFYIVPPVAELPKPAARRASRTTPAPACPRSSAAASSSPTSAAGRASAPSTRIKHQAEGRRRSRWSSRSRSSRNLLCTDVEFGWDGMYVTDWTNGWVTTGKGRLYRLFHEQAIKDPLVAETRKLMSEGMAQAVAGGAGEAARRTPTSACGRRRSSSWPVAARSRRRCSTAAANQRDNRLARLHAIWGLGQLARKSPDVLKPVAAAAERPGRRGPHAGGEGAGRRAGTRRRARRCSQALTDPSPRVRFFAAHGASASCGRGGAGEACSRCIRENDDRDAYLRHAGVMALADLNDRTAIDAAAKDASPRGPDGGAARAAAAARARTSRCSSTTRTPTSCWRPPGRSTTCRSSAAMPKLAAVIGREGLPSR